MSSSCASMFGRRLVVATSRMHFLALSTAFQRSLAFLNGRSSLVMCLAVTVSVCGVLVVALVAEVVALSVLVVALVTAVVALSVLVVASATRSRSSFPLQASRMSFSSVCLLGFATCSFFRQFVSSLKRLELAHQFQVMSVAVQSESILLASKTS